MEPGKQIITKSITIAASRTRVWQILTDTALMAKWVSDDNIAINTTWKPQTPIVFTGTWHHGTFNDKGLVLKFEKEKMVQYSYFSQISELPDVPESYLIITFRITSSNNETVLEVNTENIPNYETYGHWNFYWTVTLGIIQRMAENVA
jgi:uncharacterized protein YndB with AHSA1/START domain